MFLETPINETYLFGLKTYLFWKEGKGGGGRQKGLKFYLPQAIFVPLGKTDLVADQFLSGYMIYLFLGLERVL